MAEEVVVESRRRRSPLIEAELIFTARLNRVGAIQVPREYESDASLKLTAIPSGMLEGGASGSTGAELSFAITTAAPVTVRRGDEAPRAQAEEGHAPVQEDRARPPAGALHEPGDQALRAEGERRQAHRVLTYHRRDPWPWRALPARAPRP